MATLYNVNLIPANHFDTVYQWKNFMKSAGWTVPRSGTGTGGTTATSDLITSATVMATNSAWFVLRDPGSLRSFCIQSLNRDDLWRVKYSASDGFVGGSPSATQVPSATDEVVLLGTGTDASPIAGSLFPYSVSGSRHVLMLADTTAPYSFLMGSYPVTGGVETVFMLDGCLGPTFGDPEPVVVAFCYPGSTGLFEYLSDPFANIGNGDSVPYSFASWMGKGQAGQRFGRVAPVYFNAGKMGGAALWPPTTTNSAGANPFSGNDILMPLLWARDSSRPGPSGYKGLSRWFQFNGTYRAPLDLLSLAAPGARDFLHVSSGVVIPWNGGSVI